MSLHDPLTGARIDALVACLEEEYAALLAQDAQRLESVLARKHQLLGELAALPGQSPGRASGTRGAPADRGLARVQELNRRNAIALVPRMVANNARLRFLQSALGRAGVYSADGNLAGAQPDAGRARGSA